MLKRTLLVILIGLGSGCAKGVVPDKALEAACQRTEASRTHHAAALAKDGGVESLLSGERLLKQLDGACAPYDV